ncbi:hypothetical protein EVAR_30521_1 [Eumeta japonica]|uniref:Uncharacterized protein n=1 Tax=Eumeta variegata TaxID=151549 RepID=A0A4C1W0S6_EUMVA|nr:hypothetical protein EVAR_30521_1 [Eumeta japonica]
MRYDLSIRGDASGKERELQLQNKSPNPCPEPPRSMQIASLDLLLSPRLLSKCILNSSPATVFCTALNLSPFEGASVACKLMPVASVTEAAGTFRRDKRTDERTGGAVKTKFIFRAFSAPFGGRPRPARSLRRGCRFKLLPESAPHTYLLSLVNKQVIASDCTYNMNWGAAQVRPQRTSIALCHYYYRALVNEPPRTTGAAARTLPHLTFR